jgi:hypothetical protein
LGPAEAESVADASLRALVLVARIERSEIRGGLFQPDRPVFSQIGPFPGFAALNPGYAGLSFANVGRRWLTILSRNERHFVPLDIAVIDPLRELPPRA